jgi:hypothetical protein
LLFYASPSKQIGAMLKNNPLKKVLPPIKQYHIAKNQHDFQILKQKSERPINTLKNTVDI